MNIMLLLVGLALVGSIMYLATLLKSLANQQHLHRQADVFTRQLDSRIRTAMAELETEALQSARDKFFEHELYKRDQLLHEIDELNLREARSMTAALSIELLQLQQIFGLRQAALLSQEDSKPLDYMRCMMHAPQRRHWKDYLRVSNQWPLDYVKHVDTVVKKYDEVETEMDQNQDADFEATVREVFNIPNPPRWDLT